MAAAAHSPPSGRGAGISQGVGCIHVKRIPLLLCHVAASAQLVPTLMPRHIAQDVDQDSGLARVHLKVLPVIPDHNKT